ncbi:hypothetical protein [Nitrincola sp.]|uniref:hypothetical protein n=1 Tax=Nitrincola sp. TaxID=1926584 RepID=UPI003A956E45
MRRIGILKAERLVDLLNWIGFPAVTLYVVCMFIFPWIDGRGEWTHVQDVWNRWQGLNVGMLAFISSITAFNISRFNAEKQREREFLASKAFLPAALSELVSYFKESASVFIAGWELAPGQQPNIVLPILPGEYKVVFGNCIRHAEPEVGEYLSKILVKLQVHDARVRDFINRMHDESDVSPEKHNLISYFYRLGELHALAGKLFDYARNLQEFDSSPLEWEDFRNAYGNLDIWVDEIRIDDQMNLEAFTKRAIDRANTDT